MLCFRGGKVWGIVTVCTERSMSGGSDLSVRARVGLYAGCVGTDPRSRAVRACRSGNCSKGGVREPSFAQVVTSVRDNGVSGVIICGLSEVDEGLLSFVDVCGVFGRRGVRFYSMGSAFSAAAPVNHNVLGVTVIFTRVRQRSVRLHIGSGCCRQVGSNE